MQAYARFTGQYDANSNVQININIALHQIALPCHIKTCIELKLQVFFTYNAAMFAVLVMPKALRQLKKLERKHVPDYDAVIQGIYGLENFPHVTGIKKLTDHAYGYRLRVNHYRIFFDVDFFDGDVSGVRVISVQEVKKRNEKTYQ
jgi:mRNA-degrading endonuclease RelE of RelBE toxin-antitoxin system